MSTSVSAKYKVFIKRCLTFFLAFYNRRRNFCTDCNLNEIDMDTDYSDQLAKLYINVSPYGPLVLPL